MVKKLNALIRKGFSDLEIWRAVSGSEDLMEEFRLLYPKIDWSNISRILSQGTQVPTREFIEGMFKLIEGPELFWRVIEDENSYLVEIIEPLKKQKNLIRFNKLKSVSEFNFETCSFGKD